MPRKKKKSDDINTNAWMDTYADTITLLLTFFILLYSISSVDAEKLKLLSEALKDSLVGKAKIEELEDFKDIAIKENEDKQDELNEKLEEIIDANGLTEVIKIREEERGIQLQLDETILFDPGKANLKENSKEILDIITTIITETNNDILIEGHTDNVPIKNRNEFESNWELSTARAVSVVKYFINTKQLNPTRFSVKGYGEYNPLVENDTPENRAVNRRVDILIVNEEYSVDQDKDKESTLE